MGPLRAQRVVGPIFDDSRPYVLRRTNDRDASLDEHADLLDVVIHRGDKSGVEGRESGGRGIECHRDDGPDWCAPLHDEPDDVPQH